MTEMLGSRDFFVFDIKNVSLRKAKTQPRRFAEDGRE